MHKLFLSFEERRSRLAVFPAPLVLSSTVWELPHAVGHQVSGQSAWDEVGVPASCSSGPCTRLLLMALTSLY